MNNALVFPDLIKKITARSSYFVLKAVRAVGTIFVIVVLAFILSRASGDPASAFLGEEATPEMVAAFNEKWAIDQPLPVQFFSYMTHALQGDLGNSLFKSNPVTTIIAQRIPATLSLMIPSACIVILIGVILGMRAAIKKGKVEDSFILVTSTFGFSVPNFFLGVVLIFFFSITLAVLPSNGRTGPLSYVMPIMTLVLSDLAVFTRFTRASMIDILDRYYIMSFRSLGVKENRILFFQALPNAAIALLTISGFYIGSLVCGAIVTETIFSWPGIGSLLTSSIRSRDFPVVQGLILLFGASIVVVNFIVDVLYGVIDPRVRKGVAG